MKETTPAIIQIQIPYIDKEGIPGVAKNCTHVDDTMARAALRLRLRLSAAVAARGGNSHRVPNVLDPFPCQCQLTAINNAARHCPYQAATRRDRGAHCPGLSDLRSTISPANVFVTNYTNLKNRPYLFKT